MESCDGEKVFINLLHYPVYTLGMGERIGIWFQGCLIRCRGCISIHTREFDDRFKIPLSEIVASLKRFMSRCPSGMTVSGGEPFDQERALYLLLKEAREIGVTDIVVYSGYEYSILQEKYGHIIELIDVIIDGGFVEGLESEAFWKGSDNQKMIMITKESSLREKYFRYYERKVEKRELQIVEKEDCIYIIGIPLQRDSRRIRNGFC